MCGIIRLGAGMRLSPGKEVVDYDQPEVAQELGTTSPASRR